MNLQSALPLVQAYMAADVPVMLWGAPGVGKSDLVRQIAKLLGLPLIDLRAVLLDPVDLRGLPANVDGKTVWLTPDFLPTVERDGPEGIIFFDEINAAPPMVQAALFQLILDRRLGEYTLPPGWRILAAGNRQTDRAAAQRMPTALANRFAHIDIEPDVTDWGQWAAGAGVAPVVVAFVRFRPKLLHDMPERDARAFPTPRAWEKVSDTLKAMSPAGAGKVDPLRVAAVGGLVGDDVAHEFEAFAQAYGRLPALASILKDPQGAPTFTEPGDLFAIATGLSRVVDRQTFAAGVDYMNRCGRGEFTALMVTDATIRDESLKSTGAFTTWAGANDQAMV